MAYYQFNLSIDGCYIRGKKTGDYEGFFTIEKPEFFGIRTSFDNIKPLDNKIQLSKNVVLYYFQIEKN